MIQKKDFIEIEFSAKTNNEVFDTTIPAEAEKIGLKNLQPVIISVGAGMVIKGLDSDLEGKEIGKKYSSSFNPEQAFGKRDSKLVRMIPEKLFLAQKIRPQKGMQLSLDGMLVRVLSVSGGRVLVDFNNPLAGKEVTYDYTIKRIVEDLKEKINALQEFFFRKKFEFDIADKKVLFKVSGDIGKYILLFEKQFKDILNMDIEILKQDK